MAESERQKAHSSTAPTSIDVVSSSSPSTSSHKINTPTPNSSASESNNTENGMAASGVNCDSGSPTKVDDASSTTCISIYEEKTVCSNGDSANRSETNGTESENCLAGSSVNSPSIRQTNMNDASTTSGSSTVSIDEEKTVCSKFKDNSSASEVNGTDSSEDASEQGHGLSENSDLGDIAENENGDLADNENDLADNENNVVGILPVVNQQVLPVELYNAQEEAEQHDLAGPARRRHEVRQQRREAANPVSRDGAIAVSRDGANPNPLSRDGAIPVSRDGANPNPLSRDEAIPVSGDGANPVSRDVRIAIPPAIAAQWREIGFQWGLENDNDIARVLLQHYEAVRAGHPPRPPPSPRCRGCGERMRPGPCGQCGPNQHHVRFDKDEHKGGGSSGGGGTGGGFGGGGGGGFSGGGGGGGFCGRCRD